MHVPTACSPPLFPAAASKMTASNLLSLHNPNGYQYPTSSHKMHQLVNPQIPFNHQGVPRWQEYRSICGYFATISTRCFTPSQWQTCQDPATIRDKCPSADSCKCHCQRPRGRRLPSPRTWGCILKEKYEFFTESHSRRLWQNVKL